MALNNLIRRIDILRNRLEKKFVIPLLATKRRRRLKNTDFTIISNNCWGGVCYEYFGLPKLSPTIGCYFFAADYVKFCSRLKHYVSLKLEIVPIEKSRYYEQLKEKNNEHAIIGKLDDLEIIFLHYTDPRVVIEKWERRTSRINWEHIILKFSYQNNCDDGLVEAFLRIQDFPKFVFVGEPVSGNKNEILFKKSRGKETVDETVNFDRFINPIEIINERI